MSGITEALVREIDYTFASDTYAISDAYGIFDRKIEKMIEEGPLYEVNLYPLPIGHFISLIEKLIKRFGQEAVMTELWEDLHNYLHIFPELFYDTMNLFDNDLWMSVMGIEDPIISD